VWDLNDRKDDTLEMQAHADEDIKEDLDKHERGSHEVVDKAMGKAKVIVGDHILHTSRLLENLSLRAYRDSPTRDLPEGTVRQLSMPHAPRPSAAPRQRNRAHCPCGGAQGLVALSACVVCLLAYRLASAEGAAAQYQVRRQMSATGGKWPYGPAADECKALQWCRGGGPRHVLAQDESPQHSTGKGEDDDVHHAISPSASSSAANKPGTGNHDDEKVAAHPVQSSSSPNTQAASTNAPIVSPGMQTFGVSGRAYITPSESEEDRAEQSTCAGIAVPRDQAQPRPPASGEVSAEAGVGVYADGDCVANLHTEMRHGCSTLFRTDLRLRDFCVALEPQCRETQMQQPSETDGYAPRLQRRKKSNGAAGGRDKKRFLSWQCQFVSEDGQVGIWFV
jgi:hypothetical protein